MRSGRRKEPPTADEVREHEWWWNFPAHGDPYVLQLDVEIDGDTIFYGGDHGGGEFEPADWPGDWAMCLPPGAPEQPDRHAQPLPAPSAGPAIVDLVLARPLSAKAQAVIHARDEIGVSRYGARLRPFNGRDVTRDFTDEAADAVNYAMQGIIEAQDEDVAVWEHRFAMAVAMLEEAVGDPVKYNPRTKERATRAPSPRGKVRR